MRHRLKRLTIQQKIICLCLCAILAVYFSVIQIVRMGSTDFYERKLSSITHQTLQQASYAISAELRDVINMVHGNAISTEMQSMMAKDMKVPSEYAVAMSGLEPILTRLALLNQYVDSAQIIVDGVSFFGLNHPMEYAQIREIEEGMEHRLIHWSSQVYYNDHSHHQVLPMIMHLPTTQRTREKEPLMVVSINMDAIDELLREMGTNTFGTLAIYSDGQLICGQEYSGKNQAIYSEATIALTGWQLVCAQDAKILFADLHRIYLHLFWVTLSIALCGVVLSWLISRSMTRPLRQLVNMTKQIEQHNFSIRFVGSEGDEVGELGRSFNQMCSEMEYYVQQLQQEKQEVRRTSALKRKAELQALQMQINPHFLYNTLDSMYWYSLSGNKQDVSSLVIALSNMLHVALSKGSELISIEQEVSHLENYLKIEKIVLKDKFDYSIQVEDRVRQYPITKILIQPLAENSLVHGLQDVETGGKILVDIREKEGCLQITVEDNGCGFGARPSEGLARNHHSGYAMKNISQRLQLYYGEDVHLQVESRTGEGSRVMIRIPVERLSYETPLERRKDNDTSDCG